MKKRVMPRIEVYNKDMKLISKLEINENEEPEMVNLISDDEIYLLREEYKKRASNKMSEYYSNHPEAYDRLMKILQKA